jgi:hypothetical protein
MPSKFLQGRRQQHRQSNSPSLVQNGGHVGFIDVLKDLSPE